MTDKDIIKALGVCHITCGCSECAYTECPDGCVEELMKDALDLINRQQAEIENYSHNNEKLVVENLQMIKSIKHLKSNTIKEFWGKLKNYSRKMQSSDFSGEFWDRAILVTDGDNLVKEMAGEE